MPPTTAHTPSGEPSAWVTRWAHLLQPGGSVLDVACGAGRHAIFFANRGHAVTCIDRDLSAVQHIAHRVACVQADIENGPWPLLFDEEPIQFHAVVVTNYLWRALFPTLIASLAPGGVLLYETFTLGNETVGRPARPDFLLRPGELLEVCQSLDIVGYESGYLEPPPRFVQRIAAVRPSLGKRPDSAPARYTL